MDKIELKLVKDDLKALFPEFKEKLTKTSINQILAGVGNEFIIEIQLRAPRKTGDYANSWDYILTPYTIRIFTKQGFLAKILEYGRGEVVPIKKKVLHWVDDSGNDVFSMYSGPTQAQPHIRPTILVISSKIGTISKNVMKEMGL